MDSQGGKVMQRRSFIRGLLALAGAGALPTHTAQARDRHTIPLQQSPVAGFQYHEGEDLWPLMAKGDPLTLIREPDNQYDKRAVRVEWQGHKLGYVPRKENTTISQMLDRGQSLGAKIAAKQSEDNPWKRIKMKIWAEV